MQPDTSAVYTSPKAALHGAAAGARLHLSMQAGPICLVPRVLDGAIAAALDAADPSTFPTMDVSGPADRLWREILAAFAPGVLSASPLLAWLRADVLNLVALFTAAAAVECVRVHLQVVEDDMCPRFHVDQVGFRMVTTYRGPGTEWMAPRAVAEAAMGEPLSPGAVRRMERGTVALMRGGRNATPERPGLLHRSPPIEGSGAIRLFLAISDVDGT